MHHIRQVASGRVGSKKKSIKAGTEHNPFKHVMVAERSPEEGGGIVAHFHDSDAHAFTSAGDPHHFSGDQGSRAVAALAKHFGISGFPQVGENPKSGAKEEVSGSSKQQNV